ncbi:TetR family transcriptional regulator [Streptomyces sp. NP160]|uniref:TetR/AcrR family transcriptional regulator n=1 Tax=Streptomyces sp. NP160 TaxID=2586637 RepID=UPI001117CA42|nr:TetR family transcriptional regulator C-terminal domain-containing protein [Streptomyces sp. NP160]TNM68924.1 TetR family transcriptional regulator [Streptomyces sp. NP160]
MTPDPPAPPPPDAGRQRVDAQARRSAIVEALWRVAVRDGLEAVSARSVAAEAGSSLGAVTRVFTTQDELHAAALRRAVVVVRQRVADVPATGDPRSDALAQLAQVVPLEDAGRPEAAVCYAYLARSATATASPALRRAADAVDSGLRGLCHRVAGALAPAGLSFAERTRRAAELHALVEGLAFGLVTFPHRRSAGAAQALLRGRLEQLTRP